MGSIDALISWGTANGKFTDFNGAFDWSCENEEEALTECLIKFSKIQKEEIPTNRMCTFRKTYEDKKVSLKQVWYNCNTCNMIGENGICNACVKICHENHDVSKSTDAHDSISCNCGSNEEGSCIALNLPQTNEKCTFTGDTKTIMQHVYQCKTCFLTDLCSRCIRNCHESHEISYKNFGAYICGCECKYEVDKMLSLCKTSESVEPLKTWANERFDPPWYDQKIHKVTLAFDWSCENGKKDLTGYLISQSATLGWLICKFSNF